MKNFNSKSGLVTLIALLTSVMAPAQNIEAVPEKPINKKTVELQLGRIFINSPIENESKIVKNSDLEELRSDVLTLLSRNENDLLVSKTAIEAKNAEIKELKKKADEAVAKSLASDVTDDTFLLFGMPFSKSLYHGIMWSLVFTMLIFSVFLITRFKNANGITRDAKEKLTEVEEEFELFKRNAIEREQKLRRLLQDEINRQKKEKLVDVS